MLFVNEFINLTATNIANETIGLGGGVNLSIGLIENDFVADPSLTLADLTIMTGTGLAEKAMAAGAADLVWDPENGVWGFSLNEPAGGINFIIPADIDPAKTAFGYLLYNTDEGMLYAVHRFETPVVFSHAGDHVEISAIAGWLAPPFIGDLPAA